MSQFLIPNIKFLYHLKYIFKDTVNLKLKQKKIKFYILSMSFRSDFVVSLLSVFKWSSYAES